MTVCCASLIFKKIAQGASWLFVSKFCLILTAISLSTTQYNKQLQLTLKNMYMDIIYVETNKFF